MMLTVLHNTATAGLLTLAGWTPGGGIQCSVPKAPTISVIPSTDELQYDFSRSGKDLTKEKVDTVSPYPTGTDTTTGGLRVDHPVIGMEVNWAYDQYPAQDLACVWYDNIKVTIALKPRIYVASEFGMGPCRDAILGHERRHVDVDHEIVNKYVVQIGNAIKNVVDQTGAIGPYHTAQINDVTKSMIAQVQAVLDEQRVLFTEEEHRRQGEVDNLQEYERVTNICKMVGAMPN